MLGMAERILLIEVLRKLSRCSCRAQLLSFPLVVLTLARPPQGSAGRQLLLPVDVRSRSADAGGPVVAR